VTGPKHDINVLIVDDHPVFRIGMSALLDSLDGIAVVGSAGDRSEAVAAVAEHHPDVVLMDLDLGADSGAETTRELLDLRPDTAVLVLTMLSDDESLFASVEAGARGYMLKQSDPAALEWAVRSVAAGHAVFGNEVARRAVSSMKPSTPRAPGFPTLTTREHEVLDLVARGLDNTTIARRLHLSGKTVRNYLSGILVKVGVPDRSSLIVAARESGFGQNLPPA
jgi:DNA-binding NarL/FixJ family response regulator